MNWSAREIQTKEEWESVYFSNSSSSSSSSSFVPSSGHDNNTNTIFATKETKEKKNEKKHILLIEYFNHSRNVSPRDIFDRWARKYEHIEFIRVDVNKVFGFSENDENLPTNPQLTSVFEIVQVSRRDRSQQVPITFGDIDDSNDNCNEEEENKTLVGVGWRRHHGVTSDLEDILEKVNKELSTVQYEVHPYKVQSYLWGTASTSWSTRPDDKVTSGVIIFFISCLFIGTLLFWILMYVLDIFFGIVPKFLFIFIKFVVIIEAIFVGYPFYREYTAMSDFDKKEKANKILWDEQEEFRRNNWSVHQTLMHKQELYHAKKQQTTPYRPEVANNLFSVKTYVGNSAASNKMDRFGTEFDGNASSPPRSERSDKKLLFGGLQSGQSTPQQSPYTSPATSPAASLATSPVSARGSNNDAFDYAITIRCKGLIIANFAIKKDLFDRMKQDKDKNPSRYRFGSFPTSIKEFIVILDNLSLRECRTALWKEDYIKLKYKLDDAAYDKLRTEQDPKLQKEVPSSSTSSTATNSFETAASDPLDEVDDMSWEEMQSDLSLVDSQIFQFCKYMGESGIDVFDYMSGKRKILKYNRSKKCFYWKSDGLFGKYFGLNDRRILEYRPIYEGNVTKSTSRRGEVSQIYSYEYRDLSV